MTGHLRSRKGVKNKWKGKTNRGSLYVLSTRGSRGIYRHYQRLSSANLSFFLLEHRGYHGRMLHILFRLFHLTAILNSESRLASVLAWRPSYFTGIPATLLQSFRNASHLTKMSTLEKKRPASFNSDEEDQELVALGYKPSFKREFTNLSTVRYYSIFIKSKRHSNRPQISVL